MPKQHAHLARLARVQVPTAPVALHVLGRRFLLVVFVWIACRRTLLSMITHTVVPRSVLRAPPARWLVEHATLQMTVWHVQSVKWASVVAVICVMRTVKLRMLDSRHVSNALLESGPTKIGLAASHVVATPTPSLALNVSSVLCRMW